jgi:hypothetical protein
MERVKAMVAKFLRIRVSKVEVLRSSVMKAYLAIGGVCQ